MSQIELEKSLARSGWFIYETQQQMERQQEQKE